MSRGGRSRRISATAAADGTVLRSRELADLAATTPRALRHYHRIGLLPEVPRDPNGYRRYHARDLVMVLRIRQLGMPLRDVAHVLDQDRRSHDELLAELDRDLAKQQERLAAQRKLLSDLRRASESPPWSSRTGRPTATQQLDEDVWTLLTSTAQIDADTAATVQTVLHDPAMAERAAAWYPEFERLETRTAIEDEQADRLAESIADFADSVARASGLVLAGGELPVTGLVEQMQAETLSPAQRTVWTRFRELVEQRWTAPSDAHGDDAPGAGTDR